MQYNVYGIHYEILYGFHVLEAFPTEGQPEEPQDPLKNAECGMEVLLN